MNQEDLNKSLDSVIDSLFSEPVEKSMIKDMKPQKETADEAMAQVPSTASDNSSASRPAQISDVPKVDKDGKREGNYTATIAEENKDGKTAEQSQVAPPAELVKKSLSDEEFAEYQALKAEKAAKAQEESLKKAREEQVDLIKSAIKEATAPIVKENADLKAQLAEQGELIKSIANKPQRSKAVTSVEASERFQKSQTPSNYSKSDLLDAAEELHKSKTITTEQVIELEQTGYITDPNARRALENAIKRK